MIIDAKPYSDNKFPILDQQYMDMEGEWIAISLEKNPPSFKTLNQLAEYYKKTLPNSTIYFKFGFENAVFFDRISGLKIANGTAVLTPYNFATWDESGNYYAEIKISLSGIDGGEYKYYRTKVKFYNTITFKDPYVHVSYIWHDKIKELNYVKDLIYRENTYKKSNKGIFKTWISGKTVEIDRSGSWVFKGTDIDTQLARAFIEKGLWGRERAPQLLRQRVGDGADLSNPTGGVLTERSPDGLAVGYVYIAVNPAYPKFVKIGYTTRSVEDRMLELSSSTGVPYSFVCAYSRKFDDARRAEFIIHQRFSEFRVPKKEFFMVEISEVVHFIISMK